jgi:superfamily II helicase
MNDNREHFCIICSQQKAEGQGIRIVSEFICETCEEEMIRTDVKDDKYPFFIHQMKQIFLEKNA